MTGKRVLAIAVIALVALAATRAQAGQGGSPSPLTSFFVCKQITGQDAARRVDVESFDQTGAGWGFALQSVRLGNATLACAFARLFPGGSQSHTQCISDNNPVGCNEISPNPDKTFESLKCYSISLPKGQTGNSPPPTYTATDNLFPGGIDDSVNSSSVQYICAPASFTQNLP